MSEWKPWTKEVGQWIHEETTVEFLDKDLTHYGPCAFKDYPNVEPIAYQVISEYEEPKEKTLEERIQEQWANKNVVMFARKESTGALVFADFEHIKHIGAVSMKGFCGYIYENQSTKVPFKVYSEPVKGTLEGEEGFTQFAFPVAVLFNKEQD